jgi:hypothetical protein
MSWILECWLRAEGQFDVGGVRAVVAGTANGWTHSQLAYLFPFGSYLQKAARL